MKTPFRVRFYDGSYVDCLADNPEQARLYAKSVNKRSHVKSSKVLRNDPPEQMMPVLDTEVVF